MAEYQTEPYKKKCLYCGWKFNSNYHARVYCSLSCMFEHEVKKANREKNYNFTEIKQMR